MSEALEQNSLGFLEKDPNKLDIALKKLLFLDYLIYYDEESKQDESTIKKLSKGEIPVILKTRNTVDGEGRLNFYRKKENEYLSSVRKMMMVDSDQEYDESDENLEMDENEDVFSKNEENEDFFNENDDGNGEMYDDEDEYMMREFERGIGKDIFEEIYYKQKKKMEINEKKIHSHENNLIKPLHEKLKGKKGEEDEWEDLEEDFEEDEEEDIEEDVDEYDENI